VRTRPASFWLASALIAITTLAALAEFLIQRDNLGSSSLGMVAALPLLIKTATAALGLYLIFRGWPRRIGRGMHCRKCGYRREDDGRIVAQCPECAAPWRWIGKFQSGQRITHRWMIILGIALFSLVSGTWLIRQTAPSILLTWLPTDILLQQLASYPDEDLVDQWSEFDQRAIPIAKLDDLADALLRKKQRDRYLSRASEQVIYGAMNRLAQPTLASKQFYSQILSAVAQAPESIIRGDSFTLRTDATFRGTTIIAQPPPRVEVIAAAYIDEDPTPIQTWFWHANVDRDDQERAFNQIFKPESTGPHTARIVFWLAIGGENAGEVEFGDNGPVLPQGMRVFNQFEVKRSVTVKEPASSPR